LLIAVPLAAGLASVVAARVVGRRVMRRERARADAVIEAASELLGRSERLATTGRLAAGIAHEVGNPLAAISTYAHLVRLRAGDEAPLREPLDALEREVARIDRIVRGLLDYARPRRATPTVVRVDALLDDVVRLVADQGRLRRVAVAWDIDPRPGSVRAERHELEQVFVNLLLNAVDAMQGEGRLVLRARILPDDALGRAADRRRDDAVGEHFGHVPSARATAWLARRDRAGEVLQVVVADSGPGVPAGEEERIFEPFYSTKPSDRGTGLGLALVARTVEQLGGTIWVQPSREGGAAFVLLLPIEPEPPR
jgi:signal transduction histidine kinase